MDSTKKLRRSTEDRMIAGVAGGVAEFFDLDSTVVRLVWVLMVVFGGFGVLLYLIMWIFVPEKGAGDQVSTQQPPQPPSDPDSP
jgi:phage shock protein PspC (stress-responsive transcriptional regulator)